MAHTHHCKVCGVLTAVCEEDCSQEHDHFCTLHHPDPKHHRKLEPPPGRTTVIVSAPTTPAPSRK